MSQKWQTIKIFLSSTFRDMHAERDHLLHVVFHELKARCRKLRINLIEIDLRWGVTEKEAQDGMALDICLDEIDACRPFFVCFLGHRYGWIPPDEKHSITAQEIYHGVLHHFLPRQLMKDQFRDLMDGKWENQSLSEEQKKVLSNNYLLDGDKGKYLLKDTVSDSDPLIRSIFQPYARYQTDRSFFFFRTETLTRQLMGKSKEPAAYFEAKPEDQQKLVDLQKEIDDAGLPVFEYDNIDAFGQQCLDTLWVALQKEAENVQATDWLEEEAEFHERFMADRTLRFVGRQALLDEMQTFCQQADENNILVISGEPGSGKSTLMARFVETFSDPKPLLISHFIGASPTSTNLRHSLRRFCALLDKAMGAEDKLPDDMNELIQGFSDRLAKINRHVVIVLDAVNQFENRDNAYSMHWLPQKLPNNIRIVISTLPGDAYDALLRRNPKVKPLTGLTAEEKRTLVKTYLKEIRHDFPNPQIAEEFFKKISQATPLYILVALEELRVFGHFEELQTKINAFPDSVAALFEQVLERLEGDFNLGLVRDCMRYIACGRQGMAASELQALLKDHAPIADEKAMFFPDMLWIRLYRAFGFYLFERSGVIDFFHGELKEAVLNRYLDKDKEQTHEVIADYFEGRWVEPYSREVEELPYNFYHAGDLSRLKALLLNYEWIASKLDVTDIVTLIRDYDFLADDEAVRLVQQALVLSAHVLREDKTQLAGQLHGRLLSHRSPDIQGLLKRAVPPFPWLRPLIANLTPPGGALIRTLNPHDFFNAVAVIPDGSRVVYGSYDKTLKVLDLASGKELHTLSGHSDIVNAVTVTPDGSRVVSGSADDTLKVWDLANGKELHTFSGHSQVVNAVTVTPDGSLVVSGSWDGTLKVWNLASCQELHTLNLHSKMVNAVTVTPDGSRVVSASDDKTLKVWDLASCKELHTFSGHSKEVYAITVTPDGSRVVSVSFWDQTIKVWDLASGKELHTLSGHTDDVNAVTVTPDSSRVVSADNKTIKVWDLASGKELHTLSGHSELVTEVTVTPDGSQVVSASHDKTLGVWDLASGKKLHTLIGHSDEVDAVAVTPDGSRVVSGSADYTLKVWDLTSGKELHTLSGHSKWVCAVTVTPDCSRVVSSSGDDTLKVWDLASGKELHTLSGHTDDVNAVTVTGSLVVSGSEDWTIKVWDLTTGLLLASVNLDAPVECCAVVPDGKTIVAGDKGGMVHFIRLEMPKYTEKEPEEQTHIEQPSNTVIEKTEQLHSKRLWRWLIFLLLTVIVGIWVWNKSPESAPTNPIEKLETPVESENKRTTVPLLDDKATEDNEDNFTVSPVTEPPNESEIITVSPVIEPPNESEDFTVSLVIEPPMPIQLTESDSDSIYIVKPNDSLSKVFGKRWREIAAYNQIEAPFVIFVGQRVNVPLQ